MSARPVPDQFVSAGSIVSVLAVGSIASLASIGSIASIGSVGSIASIGSIGSRNAVGAFFGVPVLERFTTAIGERIRARLGG